LTFDKYERFRVAIISSGATVAKSSRNSHFNLTLNNLKEKYNVINIKELCPDANSCLNVYEVSKR
jgi:hypothetical protein